MFGCNVCKEKDARVSDLQKNIEFLKRLLLPSTPVPRINIEENFALDGASTDTPVEEELSIEELAELQKIEQERDAILSGNYG